MISVTQTQFRDHMGKYLAMVQEGEEIELLYRGKPVAIVRPFHQQRVPSWKQPRELIRLPEGVSVSKMIIEEREEGL